MVLEKTLESLLDCKEIKSVNPKGNQLWKFIGRTHAEAELQYFGHLMWRTNALEKTLMLGMTEGKRRREWQRMRWLDSITNSVNMNLSKLRETVKDRSAWCGAVHRVAKSQTRLSNWTTRSQIVFKCLGFKDLSTLLKISENSKRDVLYQLYLLVFMLLEVEKCYNMYPF